MKPSLWAAAIVCLVSSWAAPRQHHVDRMVASADSGFLTKAAQGAMAAVELGRLAVQKASNQNVKQLGRQMIEDFTRIQGPLKALATAKGVALPTALDPGDQTLRTHLSRRSDRAFDRACIEAVVSNQKRVLAAFRHEANRGVDPDVKAYAAKELPALRDRLQSAGQILRQMKKKKRK